MMKPTPRKVVRWVQRSRDVMPLRGYLEEIGWVRSAATQRPVDADGQPLPWMTYPMIDLLASRVQPRFRVFEYGAGFSTRVGCARDVNPPHPGRSHVTSQPSSVRSTAIR